MVELCAFKTSEFHSWWVEEMNGGYQLYLSVLLLFFSLVIAMPMARLIFFLLRSLTPERWKWPGEAQAMILWETYWLLRVGLFCAALHAVRFTKLLCQWPLWIFGVPLLLWLNKAGDVIREVAVRRGSAKTLLFEITTVVKILVLCMTFYFLYILVFPGIADDILRGFYTGVCVLFGLALVPVVRNISGSQLLVFNHSTITDDQATYAETHHKRHVHFDQTPVGALQDTPLGYVLTTCDAFSKIYVPAGRSMESPMVLFEETMAMPWWPLRLHVDLPASTPTLQVRRLIQAVDAVLNNPDRVHGCTQYTGAVAASTPTHQQPNPDLHSKLSVIFKSPAAAAASIDCRRAAQEEKPERTWSVHVENRWRVHVHGHVFAGSFPVYRQALSEVVQVVMGVVSGHGFDGGMASLS
ncbi:hypothetical protein, variant 2 [Aphanomyces invadans]|uniref:Uncharacterized protein n=1 Tax=Aphanomyces invadans TaxID=157072 RepID=A0A024TV92_9STRA|nr:hypothetical protein, variant 2 [Aphanomyces invadans]XP_008873985.1 hypothetical protein H310_09634 [Aphanomyces invadans]XP_008873986.1 hypothetical protein, variant 1 [Aphanomyces invadans]ETV97276.1 hypothetical protein H310_09634 [Aphanomyces invadans]ETV97277.1 hypothetical protein, variant 1 [Aphanomyces invadans]ETV97278.1 hypothetical protein, variant 2 [Aphanomyces invadans]|eukprot:XP_008873984.1 hypothetical protein, variant 2 [Aphanomyces invadans]